jgi:hypothetical protein
MLDLKTIALPAIRFIPARWNNAAMMLYDKVHPVLSFLHVGPAVFREATTQNVQQTDHNKKYKR